MSIGEWISLYTTEEMDIHPEFQRFYRWEPTQKSRFIESFLLGIPVPPIFVAQRQDGVWDVVDGLQRLSTIFEFCGILKNERGEVLPPLKLEKTKYLASLEGKFWESDNVENSFTPAQRILIKRTKIGVSIVLRESDPRSKYELFQRLNTGGSMLSDQEVRNRLLVMVNREFFNWLSSLGKFPDFHDCIALTDRALSEQYDVEIALRFLFFRRLPEPQLYQIGDVGEFLTDQVMLVAENSNYDRDAEKRIFETVFSFIASAMGPDAFRRWVAEDQRFKGGFSVSAFEAVAIGMGHWGGAGLDAQNLPIRVKSLWTNDEFLNNSGSGIRASTRIPKTVLLGRTIFHP